MKKLLIGFVVIAATVAIVPMFAAFEAHVINVTATIENALSVPTESITFGTVFPQEHLNKPLDISLSSSFLATGRVDDVDYFIRQKPKCAVTTLDGQTLVEGSTQTGHIVVDSTAPNGYTVDCGVSKVSFNPQTHMYGVLPMLCPYISKHPDGTPANDGSQNSFHKPFEVIQTTTTLVTASTTVDLGTADSFAIIAGSTITNTGSSVVNGNLGLSPGTAVTGFPPGAVNGTQYVANATAVQAKTDLTAAYNNAAGRTPVSTVPTELGGTTKTAGVYDSAAGDFGITGTLTLDAQGDPNAVFIFKTASTLITAGASNVSLVNGAQACNVFWQVGSSATLGSNSSFKGNIMALTSATLTTGANVDGRVLARNGAVTLDTNTITKATCAVSPNNGLAIKWNDTTGRLAKSENDTVDNWTIDLAVPCFGGYCAQDWASFVHGFNSEANPADYTQPIANEHKVFGCDLWVEVNGVSCAQNPSSFSIVSNTSDQVNGGNAVALSFIHPAWTATPLIPGATWIWATNPVAAPTTSDNTQVFTKQFTVANTVTSASIKIAADNLYTLKINGVVIGQELANENNFQVATYDTYTVTNLVVGTNTIEITGTNKGLAGSTPASNPAGILYNLNYNTAESCVAD